MNTIKYSVLLCVIMMCSQGWSQINFSAAPVSLGDSVNSIADEMNVVLSPDGSKIYFTRKNHPQNTGGEADKADVWVSRSLDGGTWSSAENINTINTEGNNSIIGLDNYGTRMLLYDGRNFLHSLWKNGQWSKPVVTLIPYFRNKGKELSGSISQDGNYLLIAMESYGSVGVEDIYVCKKMPNGTWSKVKNIGSIVNSRYQESSPYLAADNKTLFFASNGRDGQGSYDIFATQRLDETWVNWSTPKSIGAKINTQGRDISFTWLPNMENAYYVSTENSDGYGDIKQIRVATEMNTDDIVSIDSSSMAIAKVSFTGVIVNSTTNETIAAALVNIASEPLGKVYETITDDNGKFSIDIDSDEAYQVSISVGNYMPLKKNVTPAELQNHTFEMQALAKGKVMVLNQVLFERGTAKLVHGSESQLDLVVEMMKSNEEISILLGGHTDFVGKAILNLKLSEDRVKTVRDYMIEKGISHKRIEGKGYGGRKPLYRTTDPEKNKLNRRVDFTIIE